MQNPKNDLEILELYETCKEWSQSPCDYWFPDLDDPEARYLIDKHVMLRGRKIHREGQEKQKEAENKARLEANHATK